MGAHSSPSVATVWDLIPEHMFVGVGAYLIEEGRFLLALRAPKPEDTEGLLTATLVGGKMTDSDSSLSATASREALEETGSGLYLHPSPRTLVVHSASEFGWVAIRGVERPAAIVFRNNHTPPRSPFEEGCGNRGCIVVFRGELLLRPRPCAEHPAFVWLTGEQLIRLAAEDVSLADLLAEGMPLKELWPGVLTRQARLRLTDSQEALIIALGPAAPRFYAALLSAAASAPV